MEAVRVAPMVRLIAQGQLFSRNMADGGIRITQNLAKGARLSEASAKISIENYVISVGLSLQLQIVWRA